MGISLFNPGQHPREDRQVVQAGAPTGILPSQDPADAPVGFGTVSDVDVLGGLDPAASPVILQNAGSIAGSPGSHVGAAIMGVDVLDHLDDNVGRAGSFGLVGPGEEIIIGAPGTAPYRIGFPALAPVTGPGSIHLYYVAYNGVVGDDGLLADNYAWYHHSTFSPGTTSEGSEFGASLARPAGHWGTPVDYFVVGAPGEDAVYVIEPDSSWTAASTGGFPLPSTADPFNAGTVTQITAAMAGAPTGDRFGQTLHIADLDDDGLPELIVATPDSDAVVGSTGALSRSGSLWILPGTNGSPYFDASSAFEVSGSFDTNGTDPSRNDSLAGGQTGFSLTSGLLRGVNEDRVLAAGVPGMGSGQGGVCWFWWPSGFSGTTEVDCNGHSFFTSGSSGPLFHGTAVAAANLTRHDNRAGDTTDEALIEELAVSHAAELNEVVQTTCSLADSYQHEPVSGATAGGTIVVHRSMTEAGKEGPRVWNDPGCGSKQYVTSHQLAAPTPQAGAGFGRSMMVADLGVVSTFPRLIVGHPGWDEGGMTDAGRVHVTTPVPVNDFDDPLAGNYLVRDSTDNPRPARLIGTPDGYVLYIPTFTIRIEDDDGTLCSSGDFTGDATIPVLSDPLPLLPGASLSTDIVLEEADGSEVVTLPVTIAHDTSTDEITLTFDEPRKGGIDPWPGGRKCLAVTPDASGDFVMDDFESMACD